MNGGPKRSVSANCTYAVPSLRAVLPGRRETAGAGEALSGSGRQLRVSYGTDGLANDITRM